MGKFKDISGQKFGRLTAVKTAFYKNGYYHWECQCDCGKKVIVKGSNLRNGHTQSCGCKNFGIVRNYKHGGKKSRLYGIYRKMIFRCYQKNYHHYFDYGGRGIKVCDEWLGDNGFINFKEWALENGYCDDLTIDRIDVNGNYEPSNCRWADIITQANNKRNTKYITLNGETKPFMIWCDEYGLRNHCKTIWDRLKRGWSPIEAFTIPIGVRR